MRYFSIKCYYNEGRAQEYIMPSKREPTEKEIKDYLVENIEIIEIKEVSEKYALIHAKEQKATIDWCIEKGVDIPL